jgi:multiple sugar transport system permease protein
MTTTKSKIITPLVLISPAVILLSLIILIPSINAFYTSFTNFTMGREARFIGFENYINIFKDPENFRVIRNNLVYMVSCLSLQIFLGISGALVLNRRFKFQALWICLILAPFAVSGVISSQIWKYLFSVSNGFINYVLVFIGFKPVQWFSTTALCFIPIIIVEVWRSFPFTFLTFYAVLTSIPGDIIEASKLDGTNRLSHFAFITFPLILPSLTVSLIFGIIGLVRAFDMVWLFTNGGPGRSTELFAISLYKEAFFYMNIGKASAFAWVLLVVTFLISFKVIQQTWKNTGR